MPPDSRPSTCFPRVLCTDLDGTLIPLPECDRNQSDLAELREQIAEQNIPLVFVTGRHLEIVEEAIAEHDLPQPDWIICDVGTTICEKSNAAWSPLTAYAEHLSAICSMLPLPRLREELKGFDTLTLQEEAKQGRFKLSYYVKVSQLERTTREISTWLKARQAPYTLISSVDPFSGDGLIDLLPQGISKAAAVDWWSQHRGYEKQEVVFAGDSGNDLAALVAGYCSIVVGNADPQLAQQVTAAHRQQGWDNRLHLAQSPATSGVLEGGRFFGLLKPPVG